jgi:hypothetical protein
MLHWARSFALVAVIASALALGLFPSPFGVVALAMIFAFVALAVLALITDVFGKERDGSYSVTRALTLVGVAAGCVWLAQRWVVEGWSVADLGAVLGGWVG